MVAQPQTFHGNGREGRPPAGSPELVIPGLSDADRAAAEALAATPTEDEAAEAARVPTLVEWHHLLRPSLASADFDASPCFSPSQRLAIRVVLSDLSWPGHAEGRLYKPFDPEGAGARAGGLPSGAMRAAVRRLCHHHLAAETAEGAFIFDPPAETIKVLAALPPEADTDPKGVKGSPTQNDDPLNPLSENVTPLVGSLLSNLTRQRIDWVWRGRIAAGKLTVVDGDPGLGKSTVIEDIAARITRGGALPGDDPGTPRAARGVVWLTAEDGDADTILPRAMIAGADLERFLVVAELPDGSLPTITQSLETIEAAVRAMGAALLVIDPLVAYLAGDTNANRDQDVRRALAPLKGMAERTGVAVVAIRHLNKTAGSNALYRGGGSIGIIGAARCGLLFARDPDDETRCLVATSKSNLATMAPTLAYRLEGVPGEDAARVVWEGTSGHGAAALLATPDDDGDRDALDDAKDFLLDILREGGRTPVKAIQAAARDAAIKEITLKRAKAALGVRSDKEGFGREGHWIWFLPDPTKGIISPLSGLRGSPVCDEQDRGPLGERPDDGTEEVVF